MAYLAKADKAWSSERKIEAFLTALAKDEVASSTQNQAFNAIVFFYREVLHQELRNINALRAKREATVRRAPSVEDVKALLDRVQDQSGYPNRLAVHLLYGCGLRVTEPLNLRVRDVDLAQSRFIIRRAKGGKDRVVPIPCSVIRDIEAQLGVARAIFEKDKAAGVPIKLPGRMDKKFPHCEWSWNWAWVFPQLQPCADPRTGRKVRWHQLESTVQRAIRTAVQRAKVDVLPHELRHAYATHCLNRGTNPRAIQQAMGHKSLETTMGYLHAEAMSVASPLDSRGFVDDQRLQSASGEGGVSGCEDSPASVRTHVRGGTAVAVRYRVARGETGVGSAGGHLVARPTHSRGGLGEGMGEVEHRGRVGLAGALLSAE